MRHELRYSEDREPSPVTFWVHRAVDVAEGEPWVAATRHEPPLPPAAPGRGHPSLHVTVGGVELRFASAAEVEHVVDVLSRDPLPSTTRLSRERHPAAGPNRHWLSRWPTRLDAAYRQKLVRGLAAALAEVRKSGVAF